jgi:hypothetical protein
LIITGGVTRLEPLSSALSVQLSSRINTSSVFIVRRLMGSCLGLKSTVGSTRRETPLLLLLLQPRERVKMMMKDLLVLRMRMRKRGKRLGSQQKKMKKSASLQKSLKILT